MQPKQHLFPLLLKKDILLIGCRMEIENTVKILCLAFVPNLQ